MFLNSVAFQLTSYMLQLVYEIICNSLATDESNSNSIQNSENEVVKTNIKFPQENFDFSFEKCSVSQLILGTPSDITAIISLRKFLTNGLGGPILEYLQNCDIKFLTSRKILATLLMSLFPNSVWENEDNAKISSKNNFQYTVTVPTLENFINDFILLQLPSFKKPTNKVTFINLNNTNMQNDIITPIKAAAASTAFGEVNDDIETIEYDENEFKQFESGIKTSDEIALLLLNLLQKLVNDEYGLNLDENSISIDTLQFAIDNIVDIEFNNAFSNSKNSHTLKLKFLSLIQCCLNNIFIKRSNYGLINYTNMFDKLMKALENTFNQNTENINEYRIVIYELIFLIFGLLNNFLTVSNYKIDKIIDTLKWLKEEKIHIIIEIFNRLLIESKNILNRKSEEIFYKKIIELSLQLNINIKIINNRNNNKKLNKIKRKGYKQQKLLISKQNHCKKDQICCLFERILLSIFNNLPTYLQEVATKSFQKNAICCCLYSIDTIEAFLFNNNDLNIQKLLYTFISTRILKTIFIKTQCSICELKGKSYELHFEIFKLYKRKYLSINNVSELLIFLQHLLKIANSFTFDISSRILVDIVLPIFRLQKQLYTNHLKNLQISENQIKFDNENQILKSQQVESVSSLTLNLILECLNIFILYLNDVRLIKAFFINENLQHLKDLLYTPELSKVICDLIRLGLDNSSFLGDTGDEQQLLSQNLLEMQLNSVDNCSNIINVIIFKLKSSYENIDLLPNDVLNENPLKLLYEQNKLNLSQIFYMSSVIWNLTLDLYKTNQSYRKHFRNNYLNIIQQMHDITNNSDDSTFIERNLLRENKLFNIVFNTLSTFLYYYHEKPNEEYINDISDISDIIMYADAFKYLQNVCIEELTHHTKYDINHSISSLYMEKSLTLRYDSIYNEKRRDNIFAPTFEILSDYDDFNEIKQTYSLDNNLLDSLKSSEERSNLFDIKYQSKKRIYKCADPQQEKQLQHSHLSFYELFDFAVKAIKNQLPNLEILFGSKNVNQEEKLDDNNDNVNIVFDENLLYLCQPGDGKLNLLKIFEATLNLFVLDNFELKENKMQQYLNQLKLLILSNSEKYWDNIENANGIIQALQSLLKVAEIANRSSVIGSSTSTGESQRLIHIQINNSKDNNEKLQSPHPDEDDEKETILSGRISFASEDVDFHSSKASCSHLESEIELSENDTEEYYITADEGYEADAEIQELSDTDEIVDDLWNSFVPISRFRTHFSHEGICKIVVDILIQLSERCIKNPGFWANSLSQLANRLFVIRESLGGPIFLIKGFSSILKCNDITLKEFQQSILDLITDLHTPDVLSSYLSLFATNDPPVELLMKYMAYICTNSIHMQPNADIVFPIEYDGSINSTCNPLLFEQIEKIRNYHEYHSLDSPFTSAACILPITHTKIWNNEGFTLSTWIQIKSNSIFSRNSLQTIEEEWSNSQTENCYTHLLSFGTNQLMLSIYINSNLHLVFETNKPNSEINIDPNSDENTEGKQYKNDSISKRKRKRHKDTNSIYNKQQTQAGTSTSATSSSNKENLPPSNNKTNEQLPNEKSSISNALKNTKLAILNSFSQFHLFNSQNDPENSFQSSSIELKYFKFTSKKWTHLCFSVDIKQNFLNITTIIDGSEQYLISLPCICLEHLIKTENFQVACIGKITSCCESNSSQTDKKSDDSIIEYALSNFLVFDKSFTNKNLVANLTALGPDAINLTHCQMGNSIPNYGLLNLNKMFKLNMENFKESIKALKLHLIASYSVYEPKIFNGFERRGDNSNSMGNSFGVIYFGSKINARRIPSIQTATILCGGLSPLLFLFARVVELTPDSNIQALALNLLLTVALNDSNLYSEFVKKDYLNLISYVIRSDKCAKDVNLLRSIINNACTDIVLMKRNDTIQINETTTACIIYPQLIISIIQRYCDWYRSGAKESKVLDTLLKCIQILVRDKHSHQQFNMQQLNSAGLIKELLNLCKVYIIEAPNPVYISTESAESFVNIISTFAGSPPSPSLLDEIMKLLLLLQKPSECFITHDRSKFYFLISPDPPIKHKKISLPLPSRQLRNLMKERKKSTPIVGNNTRQSSSSSTFRKSSISQEKSISDKEKSRISFSRQSVERHPTNISNIINNFDSLEVIADCSRLSKSAIKYFNSKSKDDKSRNKFNILTTNKQFLKFRTNTNFHSQELKNRVNRKRLRSVSLSKSFHEDDKISIENVEIRRKSNTKRHRKKSDLSLELDFLATKDYDVVHSDEISTSENDLSPSLDRTKKWKNVKKVEFYNIAGIVKLQELLFLLLRDFVLILPDNTVEEVLTHYVKIEILLVLANHQNTMIRSAIVRLLSTLCERLSSNELQIINKKFYWHHCANQLSIHTSDKNLCEACSQWITGTYHTLDEISEHEDVKLYNKFGLQSYLAVLIQTIGSTDVAAKGFQLLKTIYRKDTSSNIFLIESGLLQICVKSLHKIFVTLKPVNEKVETTIVALLSVIAEKSVKSSGQITVLWEIFNLLSFYQENDIMSLVKGFRGVQAEILLNILNLFTISNSPKTKGKVNPTIPNSTLSPTEIRTRFDLIVDRSSQFFITSDPTIKPIEIEIKLFEQMVNLGISGNTRCNNFIAWGLLPCRPMKLRTFIVNSLWIYCTRESYNSMVCDGKMLRSLLWLLHEEKQTDEEEDDNVFLHNDNLDKLCKRLSVSENDFWNVETELDKIEMNRENLILKQKPAIDKIIYKNEPIAQNCIDSSMIITRIVAELQNSERKSLMSQMKERDESYIFQEWISIIQRMTHEGAPWFNDKNYSRSYELDDIEGPARVRTRLKRCELDLDRRFIMEEYYQPILSKIHPLDYLITAGDQQLNISLNSQILYNFPAKYLPVDGEIDGELVVTDTKLYFLATYRCKLFYVSCDLNKITEIWTKRYQHKEQAFELFLDTNRSFFFAIQNNDDWKTMKELFFDKIIQCPDQSKILLITQQWKEGLLTNWEYLMALNQISGRTYNDLMQYPVFPWILSNYTSDLLDLTDKTNFRKLEKPIAVQHENNEVHYINNYAYIDNSMTNIGTIQLKPYHYSSHYSNSGTVLHFLVRVPPFTNYFLRYQDNNFDLPDRTFHALNTTWCLASRDSPTDVKELIPEFFCLPEMFENFEKLNFGYRQSGEIVSNVQLPPWCSNDPRLFVLIHRQALESELVRNNLHHWIDLIFGYKQTGQPAVDAINVFHPATYPEFSSAYIIDPIERKAVETMIKTYGQMPRQLLKIAHPTTKPLNYCLGKIEVLPTVKGLRWGVFTGSPQLPEPELLNIFKLGSVSHLISFPNTNVVYGLPKKCCVMQGPESDIYNLISWNHDDKLIRIQPLGEFSQQSKPLIYNSSFDEITTCGSDPNSSTLWFGHMSGKISIYQCISCDEQNKTFKNRQTAIRGMKMSYNSAFRKISTIKSNIRYDEYDLSNKTGASSAGKSTIGGGINLETSDQMTWTGPISLIRHTDEVNVICLSTEFKIAVSAGRDGLAVIWDINNFNYIRTIERPSEIRHSPITLVTISSTLGDIVTIHSIEKQNPNNENDECFEATEESIDGFVNVSMNPNGKSILRLHSVNAKYVNHVVHEEKILSVCYSNIKEGVGINVIATAIEGGIIRLWSSWNLSLIKEINVARSEIISLTFSTYQHLVVLTKDGFVEVWESRGLYGNAPKFPQINFNK